LNKNKNKQKRNKTKKRNKKEHKIKKEKKRKEKKKRKERKRNRGDWADQAGPYRARGCAARGSSRPVGFAPTNGLERAV
jgi:hypothetical protein